MTIKKSSLGGILLVLVPLIAVTGFLAVTYNSILTSEEEVFTAWSQVESNYQRRADLVPSLVKTVQAYADHEKSLITDVANVRAQALKSLVSSAEELSASAAQATQATIGSKDKLSDEKHLSDISASQREVTEKFTSFIAMTEAYPNLKSADSFMMLQDQIEGTENRINIARMTFNEKAGEFNSSIRRIPGNLVAAWGGFKRKAYFQADKGTNQVSSPQFR